MSITLQQGIEKIAVLLCTLLRTSLALNPALDKKQIPTFDKILPDGLIYQIRSASSYSISLIDFSSSHTTPTCLLPTLHYPVYYEILFLMLPYSTSTFTTYPNPLNRANITSSQMIRPFWSSLVLYPSGNLFFPMGPDHQY